MSTRSNIERVKFVFVLLEHFELAASKHLNIVPVVLAAVVQLVHSKMVVESKYWETMVVVPLTGAPLERSKLSASKN